MPLVMLDSAFRGVLDLELKSPSLLQWDRVNELHYARSQAFWGCRGLGESRVPHVIIIPSPNVVQPLLQSPRLGIFVKAYATSAAAVLYSIRYAYLLSAALCHSPICPRTRNLRSPGIDAAYLPPSSHHYPPTIYLQHSSYSIS